MVLPRQLQEDGSFWLQEDSFAWLLDGPTTPPTVPVAPNAAISTDDILNLNVGIRADRFGFDLLDQNHTKIGTIDVAETSAPTITVNTSQNATRSISNLTIVGSDLSEIDPIHHRIAPTMVLQNGVRFPLGIYMFGQDNTSPSSRGQTKTPELVDETFLIDRALDYTASLPTGTSILGLVASLIAPIDLPAGIVVEVGDQPTASPLLYRVGSGRYAALAACAGLLGCYPPYLDNNGALRFKAAPAPSDRSVDHTFEHGGRILDLTLTESSTLYEAPNRYQVIGDDPATPVVGTYDLPPSAPHSAAQTGNVVTRTNNMQGLSDPTIANLAAYVTALTDRSVYATVAFSTTADPRHDTYDTMAVYGTRYLETGWSLQCTPGGAMTHQGTVIWQ